MGDNGGNGKKVSGRRIRKKATTKFGELMLKRNAPGVLSSYMSTEKLPEKYRAIEHYVVGVRENLLHELEGSPNQVQMLLLDSICETLILVKFMSCLIAEDPESGIINKARETMKEWITRGQMPLSNQLDKKLERWYQLAKMRRARLSPTQEHLKAILGKNMPGMPGMTRKNVGDAEIKKGRPHIEKGGAFQDVMADDMEPIQPSAYRRGEGDDDDYED